MSHRGFSYISNIIGMIIFALVLVIALRVATMVTTQIAQLQGNENLTDAMINMTEGLMFEISQGADISDFPAIQIYSGCKDLQGNVFIKKEYLLSNTAVYTVDYDLYQGHARLQESVVLYGEE